VLFQPAQRFAALELLKARTEATKLPNIKSGEEGEVAEMRTSSGARVPPAGTGGAGSTGFSSGAGARRGAPPPRP
jgi:hypothetical protein